MGSVEVRFVSPCENGFIPLYPGIELHIPNFPDEKSGSLKLLETVLTNERGEHLPSPLIFETIAEGRITPGNSEPPDAKDIWAHGVQAGTSCLNDRTELRLGVYWVPPESSGTPTTRPGEPIELPGGARLLAQVNVTRHDTVGPCTDPAH